MVQKSTSRAFSWFHKQCHVTESLLKTAATQCYSGLSVSDTIYHLFAIMPSSNHDEAWCGAPQGV